MPRTLLQEMLVTTLVLGAWTVNASTPAFDSQSDPVYATGWRPGDNGGYGWGGGWIFRDQANKLLTATDSFHGWFVGSSIGNNGTAGDTNGDGDINSPSTGKAWGLYSNSANNDIYAIRPFDGALSVGQTLKFDMDNGNVASSQVVGLRLLTNLQDITSRDWEFRFVGGATDYTIVNKAGTGIDTTIPFSREGVHVELTLTSASSYSVTMQSLRTGLTVTQTGEFVLGSTPILGLALKNQQAGSGAACDVFFNNLAIVNVPEPTAASLLVVAGGLLALGRRSRA